MMKNEMEKYVICDNRGLGVTYLEKTKEKAWEYLIRDKHKSQVILESEGFILKTILKEKEQENEQVT